MNSITRTRRRGTVLLMVVSLLALLFVIVTGFLAVTRFDTQMADEVAQGDQRDALLDSVEQMAISRIGDSWRNPKTGRVMGGGPDAAGYTIPGYRRTNWLASLEPVWNEGFLGGLNPGAGVSFTSGTGNMDSLLQLTYPAVSSLQPTLAGLPVMRSIVDLIPEFAWDRNTQFTQDDIVEAALEGWMDADGDGVPDTDIMQVGVAGELVNALAGSPVRVPDSSSGLVLSQIPRPILAGEAPGDAQWRRYLDTRRYDTAVRIISHGGMVTLDAPRVWDPVSQSYVEPPYRRSQIRLFESMANRLDNRSTFSKSPAKQNDRNAFFDELAAYAPSVEANLRNRFFLPGATQADGSVDVPQVLAVLQGDLDPRDVPRGWSTFQFPNTFVPSLATYPHVGLNASVRAARGDRTDDIRRRLGQRINLADINGDLPAWRDAVTLRPASYNAIPGFPPPAAPENRYDIRHLTTTINNSDDLALKQFADEPTDIAPLRTWRGEQKFYLGEVNKAFTPLATGVWQYDPVNGHEVIGQLARIYGDMLSSYSGWSGGGGTHLQAVTASQQAYMLAVNTVAFASPRDSAGGTPGWVDPVTYTVDNTVYLGYAPQPFLTEAVLHRSDAGNGRAGDLALAVELFNPQDPYYNAAGVDVFALNLAQFKVRVRKTGSSTPLLTVGLTGPVSSSGSSGGSGRLGDGNDGSIGTGTEIVFPGRRFRWLAIRHSGNDAFSGGASPPLLRDVTDDSLDVATGTAGDKVIVELLRQAKSGAEYVVDRMEVEVPQSAAEWNSVSRDTRPSTEMGVVDNNNDGVSDNRARWSVVMDKDAKSHGLDNSPSSSKLGLGNPIFWQSGVRYNPDNVANLTTPQPLGVETPLITMNAVPGVGVPMFNNNADLRPNSFPTVGFLLFVPRYSHRVTVDATTGQVTSTTTLSQTLEKERQRQQYVVTPPHISGPEASGLRTAPADMGHMPIFQNDQPVALNSYVSRVTGESGGVAGKGMPWGQLVFEYFTTLNPEAPGVDPLKVPGRININAAPWYLMSKLPILGPYNAGLPEESDAPGRGRLAIVPQTGTPTAAWPSPAFWDPRVGVLVGTAPDDPTVLDGGTVTKTPRLLLSQGVAAYHPTLRVPDRSLPEPSGAPGWSLLGPWLAQAAVAYRDGMQMLPGAGNAAYMLADAQLRGAGYYMLPNGNTATGVTYRPASYGQMRGGWDPGTPLPPIPPTPALPTPREPSEVGFVTVGELANVKGFDSTLYLGPDPEPLAAATTVGRGDFVGAVSLVALLDSQQLTTRSNTFTIYTSIMDRADGQESSSVRSQVTVDRSNQLPRLEYAYYNPPGAVNGLTPDTYFSDAQAQMNAAIYALPRVPVLLDTNTAIPGRETPVRTDNDTAAPMVVSQRRGGYFNSTYGN